MNTYDVIIHPAEEGGFWAEIPSMPGCVSEGETIDETKANIREAAEGWTLAQIALRFRRSAIRRKQSRSSEPVRAQA